MTLKEKGLQRAYFLRKHQLFFILILMSVLTYIIPSGEFERVMMDNGRMGVLPGSFHLVEKTSDMTVSFWDLFRAIPVGMIQAASVMMVVFFAGGMFQVLGATNVIEGLISINNSVGLVNASILILRISSFISSKKSYE